MVPKGNDWKEYNISEEEKAQRADAGGAKNEAHEPAEWPLHRTSSRAWTSRR